MGKVIGIDLGTTNSCVAFMEGDEAVVIPECGRGPDHALRRRVFEKAVSALSGKRPSGRRSPTRIRRSFRSSGTWAPITR